MLLYADASALINAYVDEEDSDRVRVYIRESDGIAVSPITYAEIHAACNRKVRDKTLSRAGSKRILEKFRSHWPKLLQVDVDAANQWIPYLCEHYTLKGADALQAASALTVHKVVSGVVVLAFDRRLAAALLAEGLHVVDGR